jgi:hypothetical protein
VFRANKGHLQMQMLTTLDGLPSAQSKRLEGSWAAVFYREFFSRIDETLFAVLYSEKDSRPNIPVNVLVGLEALKSGFNWSDEEMYDALCFNLQVRYALGYRNLGEGQFDLRTMYNFRHRLSLYMQETGENLIAKSFERVSDEQIESFHLKTGKVRMDSSQIASNIRNMSRLHLLVEVLQRVYRMLSETDRALHAALFAPYTKGTSNQYVYRVQGEEGATHMQAIGEAMRQMLHALAPAYSQHATYRMLRRVFAEHFLIEQERLRLKAGKELSSGSLQSPDDMEATFHTKNDRPHKGYVTNVTETCNPDNDLQLIAKVQTEPNVANDDDMLIKAIPSLKERLGIEEVHTDGGYNSDDSFQVLRANGIGLVQTAIRGHSPHEHLGLDQFRIETASPDAPGEGRESDPSSPPPDAAKEPDPTPGTPSASQCASPAKGCPVRITCPNGQTVEIEQVESKTEYERYRAHFDAGRCSACPFADKCPTRELKSKPQRTLSFDERDVEIARRRQRIAHDQQAGINLRVPIESAIASLKQPFNYDQLPVRGLFRVDMVLIGCAAMVNVRRIYRYLTRNTAPDGLKGYAEGLDCAKEAARLLLSHLLRSASPVRRLFNGSDRHSYAF